MTDRVLGFTVILDRAMRDDDAAPLIEAVKQIRGVESVVPVLWDHSAYLASWKAREAASDALRQLAADLLSEKFAPRFDDRAAATQETQSRFPSTDPLPDEDW